MKEKEKEKESENGEKSKRENGERREDPYEFPEDWLSVLSDAKDAFKDSSGSRFVGGSLKHVWKQLCWKKGSHSAAIFGYCFRSTQKQKGCIIAFLDLFSYYWLGRSRGPAKYL